MAQALFDAVKLGDLEGVRAALDAGAAVDGTIDAYLTTALMQAAKLGLVGVVRLLLERGADANASDSGTWTPLRYAIQGGPETVQILLDAGGSIEALNRSGDSILITATATRKPDVAALLVARGADVQRRDSSGWTALHYAAFVGTDGLVEALLTAGADPRVKTTVKHPAHPFKKGTTALGIAKFMKNKPLIARLEVALAASGEPKGPSLAEVLAQVEKQCLGGEAAPDALRGLWAADLADEGILGDTRYGEVELIQTMDDLTPELAATASTAAGKARLAEIRFFAREADANFLGLWKHRPDLPLAEAPVIVLDNEGTFRLTAPTIQDHFFMTARDADGGKTGAAVKELKKLYAAHGIPAPSTDARIKKAIAALPDPGVAD